MTTRYVIKNVNTGLYYNAECDDWVEDILESSHYRRLNLLRFFVKKRLSKNYKVKFSKLIGLKSAIETSIGKFGL